MFDISIIIKIYILLTKHRQSSIFYINDYLYMEVRMENIYEKNSKILKALSDPNRLRIIDILSCGEKCACEILREFNFTQPTLSHHMKILMECGLVNCRKIGTWNHYEINTVNSHELLTFLRKTLIEENDSTYNK